MKIPSEVFDLKDLYALLGAALVIIGAWRIYPPAALILSGLVFLRLAQKS